MSTLTPMMQQWARIKETHKEHLLFYRLGDFYEMFFEDALIGSKVLGLTLTGRDCGLEEKAPMCGVPYHSSEGYIAKLIKSGHKVAICEQMEDPATAKGLVSREVVRVVTPGTVVEDGLLEEDSNNYLCSVFYEPEQGLGMAFVDVSTGEASAVDLTSDDDSVILSELARFAPSEVIFNAAFVGKHEIAKYLKEKLVCTGDLLEDEHFELAASTRRLLEHFQKDSLDELNLGDKPRCVRALGALLVYLRDTQRSGLDRLIDLGVLEQNRFMTLDAGARSNLELTAAQRSGEKKGSLLWVLDKTKTPMGKRLIKQWISQPLLSPVEIDKRLSAVEELVNNESLRADIQERLTGVHDLERVMTRIVYGNAAPREYNTLRSAVTGMPELIGLLSGVRCGNLQKIRQDLDPLEDIRELLASAVKEEPAATAKDGGVIADGYSAELDELRALVSGARGVLARMEAEQRERTGISSLKIKYNKVFGYYIEVTRANYDKVPDDYIRKQTMANAERYFTQELKDLEDKLLTAHDQAVVLEHQLFEQLRKAVILQLRRIQRTATALGRLDVYQSFALVALENRYVRPVVDTGDRLEIKDGRHPVVEQVLGGAPFVPNDTLLDTAGHQISLITGPNMAGKSTYMRQTALIVLMAQTGCFVPASAAQIGVVDGIYTRIGANDDLAAGKSTFMVEMVEVADILKNATNKSLLILDEIGRGTSTYDGMSIARAVVEYISDPKKLGAKTMFATHYHELTELEGMSERIKNHNVAVKKRGDDITFLYKIVRGGADDSYGIEVAALAGVPQWVINRAKQVLGDLEDGVPVRGRSRKAQINDFENIQISLAPPPSEVDKILEGIDLNTLTPIEALTTLYKLKEKVPK